MRRIFQPRTRRLIFAGVTIVWLITALFSFLFLYMRYRAAPDESRSAVVSVGRQSKSMNSKAFDYDLSNPIEGAHPRETSRNSQGDVERRELISLINRMIELQPREAAVNIERYPTIECPETVSIANEFAVQFALTEKLITPEVEIETAEAKTVKTLSLRLPERDYWAIDVVISAPDFVLRDGVNRSTLKLARTGDSTPALFFLRPKAIVSSQQTARLYITLWHEGIYLARVSRKITIINPNVSVTSPITRPEFRDNQSLGSHSLSLDFSRLGPDLTIYVPDDGNIILASKWQRPTLTGFRWENGFSDWLDVQYSKFSELSGERAELSPQNSDRSSTLSYSERANALLRGAGRELYTKFAPQAFKNVFCQLTKNHSANFKTIQIYSNDPKFPWELLRPVCADETGTVREHEFLGTEFAVGRWHLSVADEIAELPPQILSVRKVIVIAPDYNEAKALPSQQDEIATLRTFSGYERLPGQLRLMKTLFQEFPEGMIYFTGHGIITSTRAKINEYSIQLEDGQLDLMTWRGMINKGNRNHPLFFFNACETGQTQRIANFIDGWAPAVLEAGASGYIGTLWPVPDKGAAEFGVNFSHTLAQRLDEGSAPVAEILMETRRQFLKDGDPTFLAYVYYGDACLKLRKAPN